MLQLLLLLFEQLLPLLLLLLFFVFFVSDAVFLIRGHALCCFDSLVFVFVSKFSRGAWRRQATVSPTSVSSSSGIAGMRVCAGMRVRSVYVRL